MRHSRLVESGVTLPPSPAAQGRHPQPLPPTGFTHQHATQRLTARGPTELPQRTAGARREPLVAARPQAGQILFGVRLLIALATRRRRLFGNDSGLPAPIATSPTLRLPPLTAWLAGPILVIGPRSRPMPGSGRAVLAAIPIQRMIRAEGLFAPFQQALPPPAARPNTQHLGGRTLGPRSSHRHVGLPRGRLPWIAGEVSWNKIHGSAYSRGHVSERDVTLRDSFSRLR